MHVGYHIEGFWVWGNQKIFNQSNYFHRIHLIENTAWYLVALISLGKLISDIILPIRGTLIPLELTEVKTLAVDRRPHTWQVFCILSQLRSGFSPFLNSYWHRIDSKVSFLCPDCRMEEHTTFHLFTYWFRAWIFGWDTPWTSSSIRAQMI